MPGSRSAQVLAMLRERDAVVAHDAVRELVPRPRYPGHMTAARRRPDLRDRLFTRAKRRGDAVAYRTGKSDAATRTHRVVEGEVPPDEHRIF